MGRAPWLSPSSSSSARPATTSPRAWPGRRRASRGGGNRGPLPPPGGAPAASTRGDLGRGALIGPRRCACGCPNARPPLSRTEWWNLPFTTERSRGRSVPAAVTPRTSIDGCATPRSATGATRAASPFPHGRTEGRPRLGPRAAADAVPPNFRGRHLLDEGPGGRVPPQTSAPALRHARASSPRLPHAWGPRASSPEKPALGGV